MLGVKWITTLLILGSIPLTAQEVEGKLLRCKYVDSRVTIDGRLTERCWRDAERATGFWLLERKGRARKQTECMVAYDSNNLYIAFICYEEHPERIRARCFQHDGPVWWDDCVEVYLDINHDHQTYYHLITNTVGTRYDEIGYRRPNSWNPEWHTATRIYSNFWTVEISLPFHAMNITAPLPGLIWGFNVNRQEYQLHEKSSWCETYRLFHEPKNFGHLQFLPFF